MLGIRTAQHRAGDCTTTTLHSRVPAEDRRSPAGRGLGALVLGLTMVFAGAAAGALPDSPSLERGNPTALEQAREESAVADRPRTRFQLPAGDLRLSASELLAAGARKLEVSVTLDRRVAEGALELTLPRRWVSRSGVSDLAYAKVPASGRSPKGGARVRNRDGVVRFDFADAKAGDTASFELSDVGIPAGTYELPYRWRESGGRLARGSATVVFYAPVRESEESTPGWERLANPGFDINATNDSSTESETFLTVVPGDKRRFVVGANGGGGYNAWITNDGGQTFTKAPMPTSTDAPGEPGPETSSLCCDPTSAADAAGNVWYGGLSRANGVGNPSRIVINRFAPGATTFQAQSVGLPQRTSSTQDKPMMTIDNAPSSPTFGRLYVVWNEPATGGGINIVISQCETRPGGVLNAANCDNADNWTAPVSVTPAAGSYIYADVAVGPDGKVYVTWWDYSSANAIRGDVCSPPAQNCATEGAGTGWATPQTIATLDATSGTPIPFSCPILAQPGGRASTSPQVDVDRSGGTNNGRVYVTWSDLRTDSGTTKCDRNTPPVASHLTWDNFVASAPAGALPGSASPSPAVGTRLLRDGEDGGQSNSDDWFAWLAVDQTTGQAWADFYSTREDPARRTTHFYVRTVTPAAGATHALGALNQVSGAPSDYSAEPCCNFGNQYGDYTGLDATQGIALPVWSDKRGGLDGEAYTYGESLASLGGDTQTVDDSAAAGGDGDGFVEPGESFRLTQRLRNEAQAPATGVNATLTVSQPDLTLTQANSAYPDIAVGASQPNSTPYAGALAPGAQCGVPVPMTITATTAQGRDSVPISVPTGVPGAVQSFSASPAAPIPDNNTTGVSSNLAVSGVGTLNDLNVRLNISHASDGDLSVTLRSPSGTTIPLVSNRGGAGDNFTGTVFDDEATAAIAAGAPPFTGSFRPEQPLSNFDGVDVNGTWTLTVVDSVGTDQGTLDSWGLDAQGLSCSTPPPGAIANLTSTGGVESVVLQWDDAARAAGYKVFRRNPDGSYPTAATATTTASELTDAGRTGGTEYCYKVRATNAGGDGELSGETCATAQSPAARSSLPGNITGLSAVGFPLGVGVSWDDTPAASQYYVFRKGALGYPMLPTATVTVSEFGDPGRTAGTQDCYKVQAVNVAGTGALSPETCATATPSGIPPGDGDDPPRAVLDLSGAPRSIVVGRTGGFTFSFRATPNANGSLTMTTLKAFGAAAKRKRKLVLVRKAFRATGAGRVRLDAKLSRKGLRLLKRAKRLQASTVVKLGPRTAKRTVTLKAPRPGRKRR